MKKLLLGFLLLLATTAYSQVYPIPQYLGSPKTLITVKGGMKIDGTLTMTGATTQGTTINYDSSVMTFTDTVIIFGGGGGHIPVIENGPNNNNLAALRIFIILIPVDNIFISDEPEIITGKGIDNTELEFEHAANKPGYLLYAYQEQDTSVHFFPKTLTKPGSTSPANIILELPLANQYENATPLVISSDGRVKKSSSSTPYLQPNRAVVTGSDQSLNYSNTTSQQIDYLSTLRSDIQVQVDALSNPTITVPINVATTNLRSTADRLTSFAGHNFRLDSMQNFQVNADTVKLLQQTRPQFENLWVSVYDSDSALQDGLLIGYGDQYSNDIDNDDVRQFIYYNITMFKNGQRLIVDRHNLLTLPDTTEISIQPYFTIGIGNSGRLAITAIDFKSEAYLLDKFTSELIPLVNGIVNYHDYSITSDPTSYGQRFDIIVTKQVKQHGEIKIDVPNADTTATNFLTVDADGFIKKATVPLTNFGTLPEFADNAAALVGSLKLGDLYRTGDTLKIVH